MFQFHFSYKVFDMFGLLKSVIVVFIILASANTYPYVYTCTSNFTHEISLSSSYDTYPSRGAIYSVNFNNGGNYLVQCDAPNSGNTEEAVTLYKSEYGGGYSADINGCVTLNDFVKIRTYIEIHNRNQILVPFTDETNKALEVPKTNTYVKSGSVGKVEVTIQKSILQGSIVVPEFYVYLYSRYNDYSDAYSSSPLSIVHFNASVLDVEKVCDFYNLPINDSITNQNLKNLLNNTNSMGSFTLTIKCDKDVSDFNLKISFTGSEYGYDSRFFRINVELIGVGIYNGGYIHGDASYSLTLQDSEATLSFDLIPFLENKKTTVDSDVMLDIKPVIYQ